MMQNHSRDVLHAVPPAADRQFMLLACAACCVLLQVRRQLHGVMEKIKHTVENEQPRRRSFAERCCDMTALQSALQSHPLDISVWG
jgi:hypothetical protein